jgi:hypothetical protein
LGEASRAEPALPVAFDLADGVADGTGGLFAAAGECDSFGTAVVGVGPAFQIAVPFELAEQIVGGLLRARRRPAHSAWRTAPVRKTRVRWTRPRSQS